MSSCVDTFERKARALQLYQEAGEKEAAGEGEAAVRLYKAAFKIDPDLERSPPQVEANLESLMDVSRKLPAGFRTFDASSLFASAAARRDENNSDAAANHDRRSKGEEEEEEEEEEEAHRRQREECVQYFMSEGYVVIDNCLNAQEVREAKALFMEFLVATGEIDDINSAASIIRSRIADVASGIMSRYGAGHSKVNWFARSRENVKDSFRLVLDELAATSKRIDEMSDNSSNSHKRSKTPLITSFDGMNLIVNDEAHRDGGGISDSWLHFDATGSLCAHYVQGLVNYLDSTEASEPSFVVWPKSHRTLFPNLIKGEGPDPRNGTGISFLGVKDLQYIRDSQISERAFRVPLRPGSLVMWLSSTLHCNVGCAPRENKNPAQLFRRMASYVCMMHAPSAAEGNDREEVAQRRKEMFEMCVSTTHAPDWGRMSGAPAKHGTMLKKKPGEKSVGVCSKLEELPEGAHELLGF